METGKRETVKEWKQRKRDGQRGENREKRDRERVETGKRETGKEWKRGKER